MADEKYIWNEQNRFTMKAAKARTTYDKLIGVKDTTYTPNLVSYPAKP